MVRPEEVRHIVSGAGGWKKRKKKKIMPCKSGDCPGLSDEIRLNR